MRFLCLVLLMVVMASILTSCGVTLQSGTPNPLAVQIAKFQIPLTTIYTVRF